LRKACPIAHTERFMGVYFLSRYEDVRAVAYDTEHFSSHRTVIRDTLPPRIPAPPLTSDPPGHRADRAVLLAPFTPEAVEKLKPRSLAFCNALIDGVIGRGACDAAVEYAQEIPIRRMAHMLNLPETDSGLYQRWIKMILEDGVTDADIAVRAAGEMRDYFIGPVRERQEKPGDDLISHLTQAEIDGRKLPVEHIIGSLRLLLVAGIDTTWSAIGSCLWHLATAPEDRRRLVREPSLLPTAIEELLRAYAPVSMARDVVKDTTIGGCTFKRGQTVLLSFPAACRDPAVFPDADKVLIDREENRHAAFGLGIHRCIGSNLARMELAVAVGAFLKRIPEFGLAGEVTWSEGTVRGPRTVPLRFQ
jgi:hypothetical protein